MKKKITSTKPRKREQNTLRYVIGVDEAGRGPIAGPVTVAAVAFLGPVNPALFRGMKDSKQLTAPRRVYFYELARTLETQGLVKIRTHNTSSRVIDRNGIVNAIQESLNVAMTSLMLPPAECFVRLDGSLSAPDEYRFQETIIKGDETELPIMLAGIMAKVTRDREMEAVAHRYPQYGFDVHKGYGTKKHYAAIQTHGACAVHRTTFLSSKGKKI